MSRGRHVRQAEPRPEPTLSPSPAGAEPTADEPTTGEPAAAAWAPTNQARTYPGATNPGPTNPGPANPTLANAGRPSVGPPSVPQSPVTGVRAWGWTDLRSTEARAAEAGTAESLLAQTRAPEPALIEPTEPTQPIPLIAVHQHQPAALAPAAIPAIPAGPADPAALAVRPVEPISWDTRFRPEPAPSPKLFTAASIEAPERDAAAQATTTAQATNTAEAAQAEAAQAEVAAANGSTSRLLRSSGVMAGGTAASRILGFVRATVLVAAIQPTTAGRQGLAAEAFSVANNIPNALYILLAGGILNAVLVPQITRAARMADGGQEYIDRLLTAAIAILVTVTVLVTAGAPLLIRVYSSGNWTSAQTHLAIIFAFWCLPQVFWYGLYTMLGQVLNARGSFGPFMWAPVLNNVVALAGLVAFIVVYGPGVQPIETWSSGKIILLAGTSTLGVVAQALVLIPALRRAGIGFTVRWGLRGFGLRTAGRVAGWTFAAVLLQQLGFIVISQVTTTAGSRAADTGAYLSTGKVIYDNALLLFMLPHSLVAVSLVTALFTRMSVSAAENRIDDVRRDLSLGLRLTGLATVLSAAAFLAIGPDITATLFPGNSRSNTLGIAYVAMAMMVGLVPFSAQYLFQRVFYAFEDAKTPFLVQVPVVAIWAIGNLFSLWVFGSDPQYIVIGVGVSMAIANLVGAGLSFFLLHRRFGGLDGIRVGTAHLKMIIAAAIGGLTAFGVSDAVHATLGFGRIAAMTAAVSGALVLICIYVLALRRLRVTELDDALMPLLRRR